MAILFDSSGNRRLEATPTTMPITGYPFTIMAWMRSQLASENQYGVQFVDASDSVNKFIWLRLNKSSLSYYARFNINNGTGSVPTDTANAHTVSTWAHVTAVVESASQRIILDADFANEGSATGTYAFPTLMDTVVIGGRYGIGASDMDVAEVSIHGSALTDDEIQANYDGISPDQIDRDNLVAYHKFRDIDELDPTVGTYSYTAINTPASSDHPSTIIYPSEIIYPRFAPAAASTFNPIYTYQTQLL